MLFKLAFRNVRRQISGYLIYFFTVALTVSLLFSLAGIMFSKNMFTFSAAYKMETTAVCVFLTIILAIVSAFVLGYGCAFLLRRRKKEFGLYLTLGMRRGNIVAIFMGEMFFTFLFSLAVGLGLGTLIYQAIAAGISSFLELNVGWADYSAGAFILTIVLVGVVFLITAGISAGYLRFEKVSKLLQGESTVEKPVKRPLLWLCVTFVSLAVLVLAVIAIVIASEVLRSGGSQQLFAIIEGAALAFLAIIFIYVGALKCGTYYLLKNKKFSAKSTRTFTLRQISGRVSGDSSFFGMIAVILSIVVVGGNIFLTMFGSQVADSKFDNPYTVNVDAPYDETGTLTEDLPEWMEQFGTVEESRLYSVFYVEEPTIVQYLPGACYLLRESDYYALAAMAGEKAAPLNGGALLVCNRASYDEVNELRRESEHLVGNLKWETDAFSVVFNGVSPTRKMLVVNGHSYMLAVPDSVVDAVVKGKMYLYGETLCAVNYAGEKFDEQALDDFFSAKNQEDAYTDFMEDEYGSFFTIDISGSFLPTLRLMATPWLMIVLFVTLAFALLSMAVVALKSIAAVAEDKKRYRLLYLIGASKRQTLGSLCTQIAIYFFLPFVLPLLMNIPVSFICISLNAAIGGGALTDLQVIGYAAAFSGVLLLFYALYCSVTCLVASADVKRELHSSGT